jgi:transcriptional regulatory protein RtcR
VHFSAEARRRYVGFATSADGQWRGNFRDLNASIVRLCTLATAGRITDGEVEREIARLTADWRRGEESAPGADDDDLLRSVLGAQLDDVDRFDRVQLAEVVRCCRRSKSLSAAGRELFAVSRGKRAIANDADRLRKYLARFGLSFAALEGE